MPMHTPKPNTEINEVKELPTAEQIAELCALTQEHEETNNVWADFCSTSCFHFSSYIASSYLIPGVFSYIQELCNFFVELESDFIPWCLFLSLLVISYKKFFDFLNYLVKKIFLSPAEKNINKAIFQKIQTRQEVTVKIEELLHNKQSNLWSENYVLFLIIVGAFFAFIDTILRILKGDVWCAWLIFDPHPVNINCDQELSFTINFVPTCIFLKIIRDLTYICVTLSKPTKFKIYAEKLNIMSVSSKSWSYDISKHALFSLDINSPTFEFVDSQRQSHSISRSWYVSELCRLLLHNNIPFYACGSEKIYVGLSNISKKTALKLQKQFIDRLIMLDEHYKKLEFILKKLDRLAQPIDSNLTWECYTDRLGEQLTTHFFLELENIAENLASKLITAMTSLISSAVQENSTLKILNGDFSALDDALNERIMRQNIQQLGELKHNITKKISSTTPHPTHATEESATGPKLKRAKPLKQQQELFVAAARPIAVFDPQTITFPKCGLKRIKSATINSADHDVVFLLLVPWLSRKRPAYAMVDPAIFTVLIDYITEKDVFDVLERGHVHGRKAANHTKVGAVGIKASEGNPAYKDARGVLREQSIFKMKFVNENVRILACVVDTAENGSLLVEFNGPLPRYH